MGIKSVPLRKFLNWLKFRGLVYIRTTASHDQYNYPEGDTRRLSRNVVVRSKDKDVPLFHIHTNLVTMGIDKATFENEIKNF